VPAEVLPGAEPLSVEGGEFAQYGVLVVHGFTGSPQSMRPLAEAFSAAGYTVEMPLLPGHGTSVEDLIPLRFADFMEAAEAAYRDLAARCEKTVVAGLSMGGTITSRLAAEHSEIAGIVLVNPLLAPAADSFIDILTGTAAAGIDRMTAIGSDISKEGVTELAYDATPVEALISLFEGVSELEGSLGDIKCPALLLQSRNDHVVPPVESGDLLAAESGGPVERIWLENSFHVATLDNDKDEIEKRSVEFAHQVFGA
jgi:carboxylesterase